LPQPRFIECHSDPHYPYRHTLAKGISLLVKPGMFGRISADALDINHDIETGFHLNRHPGNGFDQPEPSFQAVVVIPEPFNTTRTTRQRIIFFFRSAAVLVSDAEFLLFLSSSTIHPAASIF